MTVSRERLGRRSFLGGNRRLRLRPIARRHDRRCGAIRGNSGNRRPDRVRPADLSWPARPCRLLEIRGQQVEVLDRNRLVPAESDAAKLRGKHVGIADENDRHGVGLQIEAGDAFDIVDGDAR